ncbi:CdiI family contact-dependent growth inhibition immunity protein [Adhaeribacter sp. BT258]|uniref:CdiI family contact-dependent growth inhibition immunity protein n=1 Tax=Adhaeribacter terrigena TaxID=2793070 RepID=A0ABS1C4Z2_9BACT|nr:contact-dependent growth inhibition system immunity protein [Adhaeribacter terrigena]MBK0403713.1 CdiI family contact-dependent growth inhibition immunity protein [Adhaeribacter terrigena]
MEMNILKEIFKAKDKAKAIGATLYPDKIILATENKVKDGFWIVTDQVSILPTDIDDSDLGEAVRKHLTLSKTDVPNPKGQVEFKQNRDRYKKAIGFRSEKQIMEGARYISIIEENSTLVISSTKNGGTSGDQKGHHYLPESIVKFPKEISNQGLAQNIKLAWSKCV